MQPLSLADHKKKKNGKQGTFKYPSYQRDGKWYTVVALELVIETAEPINDERAKITVLKTIIKSRIQEWIVDNLDGFKLDFRFPGGLQFSTIKKDVTHE